MDRNRRSIRLKNHDYSRPGYYYVTICAEKRECLFGDVTGGKIVLNEFGKIVDEKINELRKYKNVDIDIYCIMPNHVHLILIIVGADPCVRPVDPVNPISSGFNDGSIWGFNNGRGVGLDKGRTQGSAPTEKPTVGEYVKRLKTLTTRIYIENVKNNHWPSFDKRLWQRNYYEHIIRTKIGLNKIREYIKINPKIWNRDRNKRIIE